MDSNIHSVGIFVLSEQTGTEEQNNEFIAEFRKQYPECVIEGNDDQWYEDAIVTEINRMNKENRDANKQTYKWVLVVPDTLPLWAEDAAREEVQTHVIYLKEMYSEEEEEEFVDMCSEFVNCRGVYFWHKNEETMEEFVSKIME
jgi:hypothetical protein